VPENFWHAAEVDLRLPREKVGDDRRSAAMWYMEHFYAAHHHEQSAGYIVPFPFPPGPVDLARIGIGNEFGNGLGRNRRINDRRHGQA
jgi:hypothetical protein